MSGDMETTPSEIANLSQSEPMAEIVPENVTTEIVPENVTTRIPEMLLSSSIQSSGVCYLHTRMVNLKHLGRILRLMVVMPL